MSAAHKSSIKLAGHAASATLWMAAPTAAAIFVSLQAFKEVLPAWFFPYGLVLQITLYIEFIALSDKYKPHKSLQARIAGLFSFFLPIPFSLLSAEGYSNIDLEVVKQVSPFVAWALPLLLIGLVFDKDELQEIDPIAHAKR